ncbi:hypothetical protein DN508_36065, partial [Burkholderia multivorans]
MRTTLSGAGSRSRLGSLSGFPNRVFVARLISAPVFDPLGDQVGCFRDVVVVYRTTRSRTRP